MKAHNITKSILALSLAVIAVSSCQEKMKGFGFSKGEVVRFSVGTEGSSLDTKAAYSGDVTGTTTKLERIDWEENDLIRIYCAKASEPETHFADYKVTGNPTSSGALSKAHIAGTGGVGLRWGEGDHYFYGIAPAANIAKGSESPNHVIATGNVSASQTPGTPLTENVSVAAGKTFKVDADMTNMFMGSKAGPYSETGTQVDEEDGVFMSFTPLTTAIEFTITNDTGADMELSSVSLISGNGKSTAPVINGNFSIDLDSWATPADAKPADGSMTVTYGREYPACTGTDVSADEEARTITIPFGKNVTLEAKSGETKGGSLTFTFLLTPTHDFEDLTFKFTKSDDSWMSTRLGYTDGSGVFFPHFKKTTVKGIMLPEGVQWTVKYGSLEQSTLAVTKWTKGIDEGLALKPKNSDLLPGTFSISPTEYVQFSKGNLFCTDKGSGNYEFSFEEKQYDYRCRYGLTGDKAVLGGTNTTTPQYTSGLFQWIPRNSNSATADWGAFTSYANGISDDSFSDFLDYGGVFPGSDWTTLTGDQWKYLLDHHTNKFVTVIGVNGLAIAPDDYEGEISASYTTLEQWAAAEADGIVFLPIYACYIAQTGKLETSELGYWSSSPTSSSKGTNAEHWANALHFRGLPSSLTVAVDERWRIYGQNVRLVQKSPKPEIEPEFVDLGLPSGLLWAKANLGAVAETGPGSIGNYYFWGETEPWFKTQFVSSSSMLITDWLEGHRPTSSDNVTSNVYQQYANMYDRNKSGEDGYIASNLTGEYAKYDAVLANGWEGRMPTSADWAELWSNTTVTRSVTVDGITCYRFANKNDSKKYILLPTAGRYDKSYSYDGSDHIYQLNAENQYWSSTSASVKYKSFCFSGRQNQETNFEYDRYRVALPIRAVKEKPTYPGWADLGIKSDNGKQLLWCEYDVIGIDANGIATLASDNDSYHSTMFTWAQASSIKGIALMPEGVSGTVRLPSYTEIGALKNASTSSSFKWIKTDIKGGKITLMGQVVFFPANGYYSDSLKDQGTSARYWCGTEEKHGQLIINSLAVGHNDNVADTYGLSVRLVIEVSPAD